MAKKKEPPIYLNKEAKDILKKRAHPNQPSSGVIIEMDAELQKLRGARQ